MAEERCSPHTAHNLTAFDRLWPVTCGIDRVEFGRLVRKALTFETVDLSISDIPNVTLVINKLIFITQSRRILPLIISCAYRHV